MKHGIAIVFAIVIFSFAIAQSTDQIPNIQHPQYGIYTAGQPTGEGFRQLKEMGIKTVINVLPEKDCIPDEAAMVTANGMVYVRVPFDTGRFSTETFQKFAEILNHVEQPVLIHCSTGNHVGAMWFGYRVLTQKTALWLALKEARQIGIKPATEDVLFEWIVKQTS